MIGVYRLVFKDGSTYIGQSVDIEKRWEEHRIAFNTNKASIKLQSHFNKYGCPVKYEVIIECHKDHLYLLEGYYIWKEKPILNTAIPFKNVSVEAADLIEKNLATFKFSTLDILSIADELYSKVDVLTAKVVLFEQELQEALKVRSREEMEIEAVRQLNIYKEMYERDIDSKNDTISDLSKELALASIPWYRKLFR